MKLTASTVRAAKLSPGKSEAIFFDDDVPGFGLRLRERGSRSFVYQYKLGAKQRRMSLGIASPLTVAEARKNAATLQARVKLGEDPASDRADARLQAAETFKAVAVRYLDHLRPTYRPRSFRHIERHLTVNARPLHESQLAKIERRDVASVISAAAGPVAGNRLRSSLSGFFVWAMSRGLCEHIPVLGTAIAEERPRERVLSSSELRAIWNALEADHFGAIIKLLALTGQRADEIASLRWSEIQDGAIALPAERTKNGRPHTIPLSPPALAIIQDHPRRQGRDLIFGRRAGGFSGWSKAKRQLDERIVEAVGKALPRWTVHDLRRSAATHMAEIGVQPHIIEAILNHVSGHKAGVAGIYNRSTYEREKATALALWADRLMAIVEGRDSNIAHMRRA
jgi:integrase